VPVPDDSILCDRLVRCLSLLVLPTSSPPAVLQYALVFPDLLTAVGHLPQTWEASSSTNADGSAAGSTPGMCVVSDAQALGLVGALLLGALHTQVTPGSAAVTLQAEAQYALLTALSKAIEGVNKTLRELQRSFANRDDGEDDQSTTIVNASAELWNEGGNDAAVEAEQESSVRARKKVSAMRAQALLQHLRVLAASLALLVGEGACAPTLRAVCAAVGWKQQNSTSTLCAVVQTVLNTFCRDALAAVGEALVLRRDADGGDACESPSDACTAGRIGGGSLSVPKCLELIKKQLKALQGLLSGGTSNKSD
jgi:hypothetical protein